MVKSFQIDLGNGRRATRAGCLVVCVAALVTFGVGLTFVYWGERLTRFDPFSGSLVAAGAGVVVFGLGWAVLRALGIPLSQKRGE